MSNRIVLATALLCLVLAPSPGRANDEPDELLPGLVGDLQPLDHVHFLARDNSPYDLPDVSNDPTVEGGTVRFFDTAPGGDDETYSLPASGWSYDPMTGIAEFDPMSGPLPGQPCTHIRVEDDRIDIRCSGSGVRLTPPFAGDLGVILTIGTNSKRYCASMGGTTTTNSPRKLDRDHSPAPASCPTPPVDLPELAPGKVVVIRQATLAKFVAKPASGQSFDLPPYTVDPATYGATLRFRDTGNTGGDVTFTLPAGPKWSQVGKSGFKYKGAGQPGDACKLVMIKTRVMKGICKGTDVTLDPTAFTGDVAVKLTFGTGPTKRYCAQYGGDDLSSATTLRRKNAPAPAVVDCPSPSGAFLDLDGPGLFD